MPEDNISRREVTKWGTTLGAISLAGCTETITGSSGGSGGGGEQYQMVIAGTSSGSSTQQAAQALARAASQHSDNLSITVQVTDGWTANLYEYNDDNFHTIGVDNNSLSKAMNNEGPFAEDPVDSLPMQGFVFTNLEIHWVAMEGSGIKSTADLKEGGYTIYPIQPGFGTRLLTEEVIKKAGLWDQNEILNVDTSDIPGAVEEGRVDALCIYGANGVNLSSWVQEVDVRSNGSLYLMQIDDNFRQAIETVPGAILKEFDNYPYKWEQDVTRVTDTTAAWVLAGQWAFGPEVPVDAAKEVARLSAEHHESIREADPTALDHSGVKSMTTAILPELEIHPGVAKYWKENDVWNDEWQEGATDE
ncbi:TAXI family TRAP transporter solute-binding subunit [Halegenticoccus soli]|uniref:TAXI family TRAP transporter solute-binding subunit n=1 Tax=Halegenticoccus soli TaxID=1985678 RepID=UPI000C6DC40A|nr:TAXI family TRAP transporter solute-binding subunit [Halegenticoccus soli]